ncbi:hypothetical protein CON65_22785 [Bacillus pseudomycoides]|uniref:DUF3914 domain-containing protein n=1 Tax=Bacillus pseudomycoides TaxID=64104 RepID=A0AA91V8F9_9BACI|nr:MULTISPECIES: DUF3914 domain-containing protein [Bacillus]PEB50311.1 hypothetical protein COO03_23015 [Bacillus sp. AFS098217]PED80421.1 hypothetical protein CON65_22785 [Bacillus pseudomycoides]PEU12050.1 hypothetical protein CN525_21165 [Bacillus sp. AFS014408]PEU17765.1 hypothetical protein CN524_01750 [Bacillus sp. AFS019443]PFW60858.1 hypothetical protein COL20_19745 [Bacillus sp. AFS075034]
MRIGLSVNTMYQPEKLNPSNVVGNDKNNFSTTKVKDNKPDDSITFDIQSSEKETKQPSHKFTEVDLWKMLKDKGVPLWIILEILKKFRAEKDKEANTANATSNTSNTFEPVNETRLNEVM